MMQRHFGGWPKQAGLNETKQAMDITTLAAGDQAIDARLLAEGDQAIDTQLPDVGRTPQTVLLPLQA